MSTKEIEKLKREKRKAEAKGDLREVAQLCNVLGETYAKAGEYDLAISEHEAELNLSEALADSLGAAVAHRKIGERHSEMGNFSSALHHHKLYISGVEGHQVEEQRSQATIGRTYLLYAEAALEGRTSDVVARDLLKRSRLAFEASLHLCEALSKDISAKEAAEMRSGLYLNLGHVYNCRNDTEKSAAFMKKAVSLATEFSLHEMVYMAQASLASYYHSLADFPSSVTCLLAAIEAAGKSHNKEGQVETMCSLAATYLAAKEPDKATKVLKKAYKMSKSMGKTNKDLVISRYKTVRKAIDNLKDLQSLHDKTDSASVKKKMRLYESLGDCMADMSIYQLALKFYNKQLKCAEVCEVGQSTMSAIYVSLAQTYMDLKDYLNAIIYYKKELFSRKDDLEQQCRTLLNIADAAELSGQPYEAVKKLYEDAVGKADAAEHSRLKVRCLKSLAVSQLNYSALEDREHTLVEVERIKQQCGIDDDEEESQQQQLDDNDDTDDDDDEDILEELSESDLSDSEEFGQTKQPGQARRTRTMDLKKNEKGETLLHRACIEGKIKKVKALLDKGHPVHVRDNCGWQPIHEACNHGYTDILELLLDRGADINDRGGEQCGGITPLHDAASAGNLHIMKTLLTRGANVHAKDDEGNTPLDTLRDWMNREIEPFSQESLQQIRHMEHLLLSAMQGNNLHLISSPSSSTNFSQILPDISAHRRRPASRKSSARNKTLEVLASQRNNRSEAKKRSRNPSSSSEDNDRTLTDDITDSMQSDDITDSVETDDIADNVEDVYLNPALASLEEEASGAEVYKQAIENIGARSRGVPERPAASQSAREQEGPALIAEDEVLPDDWLIDDMPPSPKAKRKRVSMDVFVTRGTRRPRSDSGSKENQPVAPQTERFDSNEQSQQRNECRSRLALKKKSQTTLTQIVSRVRENQDLDDDFRSLSPLSVDLGDMEPINTSTQSSQPASASSGLAAACQPSNSYQNIMRFKVRINDKVILVPFMNSEVSNTIQHLASAAADRYNQLYQMRPILCLSTKDGALLSPDDVVSFVLTPDEEVVAAITGWDMIPLQERFEESCRVVKTVCHNNVKKLLESSEATHSLCLQHTYLWPAQLQALCRSLMGQASLRDLHLTGTNLVGSAVDNLTKVLPTLTGLKKLNLTSCRLTLEGLGHLAKLLDSSAPPLQNLEELSLGYNPLGDESAVHMTTILKGLRRLKRLDLSCTGLTVAFFKHHRLALASAMSGGSLQHLVLADNKLGSVGVELLLMCVTPVTLNLRGTVATPVANHIAKHLLRLAANGCQLQELQLDNSCLTDDHGQDLARFVEQCPSLQKLSLSCNPKLTASTLSLILEGAAKCHSQLQYVSYQGCGLATPIDTGVLKAIEEKLRHDYPLINLNMSCQKLTPEDISMLKTTWCSKWQDQASVDIRHNFIQLSVSE